MTIANASTVSSGSLPAALRVAQAAIQLPEVQDMLCRLSEYKLGIYMPHMHDEESGDFQPLPDNAIQVESGLEVSFQAANAIANHDTCFLPVGWVWRAGASIPLAVCEMDGEEKPGDTERNIKHKMPKAN